MPLFYTLTLLFSYFNLTWTEDGCLLRKMLCFRQDMNVYRRKCDDYYYYDFIQLIYNLTMYKALISVKNVKRYQRSGQYNLNYIYN